MYMCTFISAPENYPESVSAVVKMDSSNVELTWSPLADDPEIWNFDNVSAGSYEILYQTVLGKCIEDSSLSLPNIKVADTRYEFKTLKPDKLYSFGVAAFSVLRGNWSTEICIMLPITGNTFYLTITCL